ncbi:unnamed protein product [Adineta steineri]|uniref:Uncharacterized protein n=2 Tax=Adineta steineri TaxID=433720 RepID=A0A814WYJ3_9BILA|nr:unnamed protein product [Adineta steineri]
MNGNIILKLFINLAISSIVIGHFVQENNVDDSFISVVKFDTDVIYYSYHIHVYFLQKNTLQRNEALLLRKRFLSEFNVTICPNHCDTWCPQICHWDFNRSPTGPHPIGSWGVYIPLEQFTRTVSFISMYHGNLSVLIHPNSGHPKIDHLLNAFWIKSIVSLRKNQLSDNAPPPSSSYQILN